MTENLESNQTSLLYPATLTNHFREQYGLPGSGMARENCGEKKLTRKCSNPDCSLPIEVIPHSCRSPLCPICWPHWASREANRETEKEWETLQLALKRNRNYSISSVVFSPSGMNDYTWKQLYSAFNKAIKRSGAVAVSAKLHLWRFRDSQGNELEHVSWKEFQAHPGKYIMVRSPHFHCKTIGKLIESDHFHEHNPEWIYKKFYSETTKSYSLTRDDVWHSNYYELSHSAIPLYVNDGNERETRAHHVVHYYGLFWRSRVIVEHVDYEEVLCPLCGSPIMQTYLYDRYACGENVNGLTEPYYRKVITRTWGWKPRRAKKHA